MSEHSATPLSTGGEHAGASQPPTPPPPAPPQPSASSDIPPRPAVPSTRTGIAWWALGLSLLLLIIVLVFVLQNLTSVRTNLFSVKWTIPLGLDLLLAVLLGGVIAFLLGAARMLQLRRLARRYARTKRGR